MASILVRTATPDGVELDGALDAGASAKSLGLDGVVLFHGTGSNFYASRMLASLLEPLTQLGLTVIRANTRGHDGINTVVTRRGGLRLGAAFETVDDCRHDVRGWTEYLRGQSGPRVVLLGHSLGAVKCLYAAAHDAGLEPAGVIAVSPPRLSYEWFCQSPHAQTFLDGYRQAEDLVRQGKPQALFESKIPLPMAISAAGYVDKYGPEERYNLLRFVRHLNCPTLFTFGSLEVESNVAFQQLPEEVEAWKARGLPVEVQTIAGADHVYSGKRSELADAVLGWLTRVFSELRAVAGS